MLCCIIYGNIPASNCKEWCPCLPPSVVTYQTQNTSFINHYFNQLGVQSQDRDNPRWCLQLQEILLRNC
jgi:hypothetical protein